MLWSSTPKMRGHSKVNQQVRKSLYSWIIQHPGVVVSPIENNCLKVSIEIKV